MRIQRDVFLEVLSETGQYIEKLVSASESIGELFYSGSDNEKMNLMAQYFSGAGNLLESLMMTLSDAKDHAPSIIGPVNSKLINLSQHLTTIEESLKTADYINVADVMTFDMVSCLSDLALSIKEPLLS